MDHVGGGAAGPLAVVAAFDEGDVHSLQRKVTESSHAVDTSSHHEDLGMWTAPEVVHCAALHSWLRR